MSVYNQGWINPWAKGAAALGPRFYRAPTFDFGFFFNPFLLIVNYIYIARKIKIKNIDEYINVLNLRDL